MKRSCCRDGNGVILLLLRHRRHRPVSRRDSARDLPLPLHRRPTYFGPFVYFPDWTMQLRPAFYRNTNRPMDLKQRCRRIFQV